MRLAATLSFVCGFASLSLEILWVRLYGFAKSSTPAAFGFVLAIYLTGIAIGAAMGARACRRAATHVELWTATVWALLLSSALCAILPGVFAWSAGAGFHHPLIDVAAIGLGSAVLSFVFPIAHHLGTRQDGGARGRHFARVYTANVAGAALGPLVTGYILLDIASLQSSFLYIGMLQALAAAAFAGVLRLPGFRTRLLAVAGLSASMLGVAVVVLNPHAIVRQFKYRDQLAKAVVENRQGIIAIYSGGDDDDVVLGGNVYDGRTNLDSERNTNGLERTLLGAVLPRSSRRVLVVGLSIGTWLAILREFPDIANIDVVEINPGYLEAMRPYGPQTRALSDPRVHLVIDDARRWLRNQPDRRYDLVVMNTTLYWRANASLLLSREMMAELKSHMAPGAVLAFNATYSPDAFLTAAQAFRHAYRFESFVYASDFDFRSVKDSERARAIYRGLRLEGRPFFAPGSQVLQRFLAPPFRTIQDDREAAHRNVEEVTDDNMLTEFRRGKPLYYWTDLLAPPGS